MKFLILLLLASCQPMIQNIETKSSSSSQQPIVSSSSTVVISSSSSAPIVFSSSSSSSSAAPVITNSICVYSDVKVMPQNWYFYDQTSAQNWTLVSSPGYWNSGYTALQLVTTGNISIFYFGVTNLNTPVNTLSYQNGHINFLIKGTLPFQVGMSDIQNTSKILISPGSYGYTGSNLWEKVSIPISLLSIDFVHTANYFVFYCDSSNGCATGSSWQIDEIFLIDR